LDALRPHDVFDPTGRAFRWAAATKRKVQNDYARWLRWLTHAYPQDLALPPIDRVTQVRIGQFAQALSERQLATSVASSLEGLWMCITVIAPASEFIWLRKLVNRMTVQAKRSRPKSVKVRHSAELFSYGLRLMSEADARFPNSSRQSCLEFRDGLMIALLAARPIRLRNLHMMRLGTHLIKSTTGYRLVFEPGETKQGVALYWRIPSILTLLLDRYFAVIRPFFARGLKTASRNSHCWLTLSGKQLKQSAISQRFTKLTNAVFGVPISPHHFRHCAVTSIAADDPAAFAMAPSVLGNFSFRTIETHYNQAMMFHASRRYQAIIAGLRASLADEVAFSAKQKFLPGRNS
jgi:hypothetical protein